MASHSSTVRPTRASPRNDAELGLAWLIRLRWLAVSIQLIGCVLAASLLGFLLPWGVLIGCFSIVVLSNAWLLWKWEKVKGRPERYASMAIFTDIALLTILFFFAGGSHNPFTGIYVLHVALAATLLSSQQAWTALGASLLGFGLLFFSPYPLLSISGATCCDDFGMHLWGMYVSAAICGGGVVYFFGRLQRDRAETQALLEKSRAAKQNEDQFRHIASLAAGIAHELASPLGTIAIAAKDIEYSSRTRLDDESCLDDARLIRSEVERCRLVIERASSHSEGRPEDQPASELALRDLPSMLSPFLTPRLSDRIEWQIHQPQVSIRLPIGRLLQSLAILAKNAVEASPDHLPIQIAVSAEADRARFEIIDSGTGIDPGIQERLGEPFFTTKSATGGMGLGVFLVGVFCTSVGGNISFKSAPPRGTTVTMDLPLRFDSGPSCVRDNS